MRDYKNTLNLPQTDFPMKANLSQREPEILKKWQKIGIYEKLRSNNKGKKKFILHVGPPYANGNIHLGTATNAILKDMIVKAQTLSGFDAPLVPGWDCHGLPIEHNVEKKIGKAGQKVSATDFRSACRDYARNFVNSQCEEFKRLGIIADWEHPYLTMDFKYEADIVRSLIKIIKNGYVQQGYKPVHWCLDCASALAEAEVEYIEKTSPSIDVGFAVVDENDFLQRIPNLQQSTGHILVPIWTTTPWTLPANQAVALSPYLEYVLIECNNKRFLIAEALLVNATKRYQIENHRILGRVIGEKLAGVRLQHPFYDKTVPIVIGDHVTVDSGTGAVHIAPAHGQEDYVLGQRYQLPLDNPIGDDGCYTAATPFFSGMHVSQANDKMIEVLREHHTLLHLETLHHSYPHCWRHKTPLIFRSTPQWFISMNRNNLRKMTLQAINGVIWIPDWGKSRITGMIENRPDWCISRQRAWGVPLALFIHKETGELHPKQLELMEQVAQQMEQEGIEAWYKLDKKSLLGNDADQYIQSNDVLDVWYDSGVSHECVLKQRPELTFPADIVLEGSDQHRGWFQSSLLTSMAINQQASYREVLTHGFVVDGQGRKMSKSLGNVIAPAEVIKNLGADILRLWVASIDYRYEICASNEILTRTSEAYRRMRNTARFLLANLQGFNPEIHLLEPDNMLMLDRWAVDKTRLIQEEILKAYETYQFHLVVQALHHFCAVAMGGFYLDIIKDRQYTMGTNSRGRRSAQTALYHIVQALVHWMAPILSFTAEEIWHYIPGQSIDSVFLANWYASLSPLPTQELMGQSYWEKVRTIRDAVNKEIENQRNAGNIGSALEAEVFLYCSPQLKNQLDVLGDELRFVLITSSVKVISDHSAPANVVLTDIAGLAIKVEATTHVKCERCWHRCGDVNQHADYPGICGRCVENIAGLGESREYA
ncbi:MAG TPA: isoleucine--tRNA ligase [Gammaproteobacteria bacterium]|nr:isoleucine--tRNA ligase [Gammaproteobacteria bacterium]